MSTMNDKVTYIGIDPGKDGAIAAIFPDGSIHVCPFDKKGYLEFIDACWTGDGKCKAVLEQVATRPHQGIRSAFTFGENYGWIKGVLDSMFIPYTTSTPVKWKKHYGLIFGKGTPKPVIKRASVEKAKQLYPNVCLFKTPRCKKEHDGLAESLLLARFLKDNEEVQ